MARNEPHDTAGGATGTPSSLLDAAGRLVALSVGATAVTYAVGVVVVGAALGAFGAPLSGFTHERFLVAGAACLVWCLGIPFLLAFWLIPARLSETPADHRTFLANMGIFVGVSLAWMACSWLSFALRWHHLESAVLDVLVCLTGAFFVVAVVRLAWWLLPPLSRNRRMAWLAVMIFVAFFWLTSTALRFGRNIYLRLPAGAGGSPAVEAELVVDAVTAGSLQHAALHGRSGRKTRSRWARLAKAGEVNGGVTYRTPALWMLDEDAETYYILIEHIDRKTDCVRIRKSAVVSVRYRALR